MKADTKQNALKILSALGLDEATAVDMFLRQVIIHNGLPFRVSLNEVSGDDFYGPFDNVDDLMKSLNE